MTTPETMRPTPVKELSELWRFRDLLCQMVARELNIRYKNSVLGFFWSIIPPILQVLTYSFLFVGVIGIKIPSYSAYLLSVLIPWTFFQTAILDSCDSLLYNYSIIKKVYFSREIVPLAKVFSNTIHFLLAWVVYFVAFLLVAPLFGGGIKLLPTMVFFPVLIVLQVLLVIGISLWVSALQIFYHDVKFILTTLFPLLFFLLPIMYPADIIYYTGVMQRYPWLYHLYMLNPQTALLEGFRKCLLEPVFPGAYNQNLKDKLYLPMQWGTFTVASLLILLIAWGGYAFFNRRKWKFVERP